MLNILIEKLSGIFSRVQSPVSRGKNGFDV